MRMKHKKPARTSYLKLWFCLELYVRDEIAVVTSCIFMQLAVCVIQM